MKSRCALLFGSLLFILSITLPNSALAQPGSAEEAPPPFTTEELHQLLAPIALYPDVLLSQILMAATYPIEIIEAERWISSNPGLSREEIDAQLVHFDWAPSVKALCHFPVVLSIMSERIAQTTDLGNAFLSQEESVMSVVQELRAQAREAGTLADSTEQKILVEQETIIIEPTNPRVIYVPLYNPYLVYGNWRYPAHLPYYWVPAGMRVGDEVRYWPGYQFHFVFGSWSRFDWRQRSLYLDPVALPVFIRDYRWWPERRYWHHDPYHRRGIPYHGKPFREVKRHSHFRLDSTRNLSPNYLPIPPAEIQQIPAASPLLPRSVPSSDDMNQREWHGTSFTPGQHLPQSRPLLKESYPLLRERNRVPR